VDAYLRYSLHNDHVVVIGVAFEDEDNSEHTLAACLGITEVPGRQTIFQNFTGKTGFTAACEVAVSGELPAIKVPEPRPSQRRTLREALDL
jgi:hypothetical protein